MPGTVRRPNLGAKRDRPGTDLQSAPPGAYIAGTLDADCRDIVTPASYPGSAPPLS